MKKLFTFLFLLGCTFYMTAQVAVTFAVDMNGVTEFDPAADVLKVRGSFNGWGDASGDNVLTDEDGDGAYSVTIEGAIFPGEIQFKYLLNDWGTNEFGESTPGEPGDCTMDDGAGNVNRIETIPNEDAVVLTVYKYNGCEVSDLPASVIEPTSTIKGITVSPNPFNTSAIVTIDNPSNTAHDVIITNMTGQVVELFHNVTDNNITIEKGNLTKGIYFIGFRNAKGEVAMDRLVIQ